MEHFSTLVDLLQLRAFTDPSFAIYTFASEQERKYTYKDIDQRARAIAAHLMYSGSKKKRALLLYEPGPEYISAFFGCLYANVIAVPAYPLRRNRLTARLTAILADAQIELILTTTQFLPGAEQLCSASLQQEQIQIITTDSIDNQNATGWVNPQIQPGDLAFLQYTSGSTSIPKGVMLTHVNLLHNLACIKHLCHYTTSTRAVSWLPPYHDLGLIGGILQPIYANFPITLMTPVAFMQNPLKWLQIISSTQATTSGAPNFAYELCIRRSTPAQRDELDLRHWESAIIGAEPIRPETLKRFTEAFSSAGFSSEAWYPCYGLAEATLVVSGGPRTRPPEVRYFDIDALNTNRAHRATSSGKLTKSLVSSGYCPAEEHVVIVHPDTHKTCLPGEIGEIWVSSLSVAQGYWGRDTETKQTFGAHLADTGQGPFLRTGDLGFFDEEALFVTGRLKDLILIRGRNLYPQDIELTVQKCHPLLRPDCGAAFSIELEQQERLIIVQEVERTHAESDSENIINTIRRVVAEQYEVQVYAVVLQRSGHIPKTSSGKIQRNECRTQFMAHTLPSIATNILPLQDINAEFDTQQTLSYEGLQIIPAGERNDTLEQHLRIVVSRLLNISVDRLDVQQPLLTFGLDSLSAIELCHYLKKHLNIHINLDILLRGASIRDIIQSQHDLTPTNEISDHMASFVGTLSEYPLSYGQQALWFLQALMPDSCAYNIARAVRITHDLDITALQRSLQTLVDRHALLRTAFFTDTNQELRQRIYEQAEVSFRCIDATDLSDAALHEVLQVEMHRPFNLQHDALFRVSLFTQLSQEYILLFVVHHIIADMWSLAILIQELSLLYDAISTDQPISLPALPVQYADYVQWQTDLLTSAQGKQMETYWQQQIADVSLVLDIPGRVKHQLPPAQTDQGSVEVLYFDTNLTKALKKLSLQQHTTLYVTLLAAFQVLLYRYSGQEQFIVGSPVAGRQESEWAHVVGYFTNLVAIRCNTAGNPTFLDILQQVQHRVLKALENSNYPFVLATEQFDFTRDVSRSSILQVVFAWQQLPYFQEQAWNALALGLDGIEMPFSKLNLTPIMAQSQASQFDLMLSMTEMNEKIVASIQYKTALFDAATIISMLKHFQILLSSITATPHQHIGDLTLISRTEQEQLLVQWNDTQTNDAQDICFPQLFEEQAERVPDAVALIYGDTCLTYQELNQRANGIAAYLENLGIESETVIGLCMEQSLEMVFCLLGILKAGGVYLPLDPTLPEARLSWMLENAQVAFVLTRERLAKKIAFLQITAIQLETLFNTRSQTQHDKTNGSRSLLTQNLAYIIYTSGSTGKPKGVQIAHRAAVNLLMAMRERLRMNTTDRLIAVTTISFDIALFDLLFPLSAGACTVLVSRDEARDGRQLGYIIARLGGTIMQATPATWSLLIDAGWPGQTNFTAISTGEALPMSVARGLLARAQTVWNLYGPTETTIWSTGWKLQITEEAELIGQPLANTHIYLLASDRRTMVPIGAAGEIYIGGTGVARGYLGAPEVTAERFVPDHLSGEIGARLYRTGDLGRYHRDGSIEYLGRIDHQVKVRGYRIELGEIEAVLGMHPDIRECVVEAVEDKKGDKHLIAYIVPQTIKENLEREILQALQRQLPAYMVPISYIVMQGLPLTSNGKVDRQALPMPVYPLTRPGEVGPRAPEILTPVEEVVAGIYATVLALPYADAQVHFFESGGHSLLATQAISRLQGIFQLDLPLRYIFEAPTVAGLSRCIEQAQRDRQGILYPSIVPVSREQTLPLSFAQQRLWFLHQLEPAGFFYNTPVAVRIIGPLAVLALEQSFQELIDRHESLRTIFVSHAGSPVQIIHTKSAPNFSIIDLQYAEQDTRNATAMQIALEAARQPFDLSRGPLLHVLLLRINENEHLLVLIMHHIISDGWSLGILHTEVMARYEALANRKPLSLASLPVQYADFAVWQRKYLAGDMLNNQLAYWQKQLENAPALLDIPTDRPRLTNRNIHQSSHTVHISQSLTIALKSLSHQKDATLFIILLTALMILLFKWTEQEDIIVGTVIANRTQKETDYLIGCFMNFLALRSFPIKHKTGSELLLEVKNMTLEAYMHQDCPFDKLVETLKPERSRYHNPFYNVAFLLQNFPSDAPIVETLQLTPIALDTHAALLDLRFVASELADGLSLCCEYDSDLFESTTIEALLASYCGLLVSLVQQPDKLLSEFELSQDLVTRAREARMRNQKHRIVLAATFTAEPIEGVLSYWMQELNLPSVIKFAPYNQIFQQLLDPASVLVTNQRGVNVILIRFEDWQGMGKSRDVDMSVKAMYRRQTQELVQALEVASQHSFVPYLVCICPASPDVEANQGGENLLADLEEQLSSMLVGVNGVFLVRSHEIQMLYPVSHYADTYSDKLGHIPYTPLFFAALATMIARKIYSLRRVPYKVIVLDCDQTLWQGICGEDGPYAVTLDAQRKFLHEFLLAQQDAGALLCLCSKNNQQDVFDVFASHPEWPLKREHFIAWRINWQAKSQNLRSLAQELQLSLDSFIFIDNNPLECADVQAHCPEILTLPLPEDSHQLAHLLLHYWAFDRLQITEADKRRTDLYKQQRQRQQFLEQSSTLETFLKGLDLRVTIATLEQEQINRAAQLTQRTNQFNCTTIRRSESEILRYCQIDNGKCLTIAVTDRFGDYGIVGLMLFIAASSAIEVDTFLLSCRVLGRGVEHRMLAALGSIAREQNIEFIHIPFMATQRNQPALDFLQDIDANCKLSSNGHGIFTISSQSAAQLRYKPATATSVSIDASTKSEEKTQVRTSDSLPDLYAQADGTHMLHIATELSTPEQVLQRVSLQRRNRPEEQKPLSQPDTDIEKQLVAIWEEVLQLEWVGIHDNFFAIGGHSLLATQLLSHINQVFQVELPLRHLFDMPTITELANIIMLETFKKEDPDFLLQLAAEVAQELAEQADTALAVNTLPIVK